MKRRSKTAYPRRSDFESDLSRHRSPLSEFLETSVWPRAKPVGLALAVLLVLVLVVVNWSARRQERLAQGFMALGRALSAAELEEVSREHSGSVSGELAALAAARSLMSEGQYDQAVDRYSDFLERYPNSSRLHEARFGQATACEAAGDLDRARELFSALAEDGVGALAAQVGVARCFEQSGRLAEALEAYEKALAEAEEDGALYTVIADAILRLSRPQQVVAAGNGAVVPLGEGETESPVVPEAE
jgi:tetratricopeptide (TPR) repeat protein